MCNAVDVAAKEAKREYERQWRKNNPDKVRAKNRRYWEKKGREILQKATREGQTCD